MAEKFICVRKYDSPCEKCEVKKICGRDCVFKEMFEKDPYKITRTEAIERMAKAFVEYERTNNPTACEWTDLKERAKDEYYRKQAGVMLDALLGE